MASIKPFKDGKRCRVSWYDAAGVRRRIVLPSKEAKALYEEVHAQKFFEKTGMKPAHKMMARNFEKMSLRELAERYKKEHLLYTRAKGNVN